MQKRIVPLAALTLLLAVLLPSAGCGSADQGSYFRAMSEIGEGLNARLEALVEEAGEAGPSGRMETGEGMAEVLEKMAAALEEGVLEMRGVKVPAGGEEAHLSLLELLSQAAEGYRKAAALLSEHTEEGEGGSEAEVGAQAGESDGHPSGEVAEEGHSPRTPSEEASSTSSH